MKPLSIYHDELVDLIYSMPENSKNTVVLMQRLSTLLNVSLVQLMAMDFVHQTLSHNVSAGNIPEDDLAAADVLYFQYPIDADPRWTKFLTSERQGWYRSHDHVTDDFIKHSSLYQEIMLPVGLYYSYAHEILFDENLCVILALHTSYERGTLQSYELDFLNKLLPHLKRVVRLQRHIYQYTQQSLIGYEMVNKLPQPIVLLNLSGGIAHYNKPAQHLAANTKLYQLEDQFRLISPYNEELKQRLLHIEHIYRYRQLNVRRKIEDSIIKVEGDDGEILYIFISVLIRKEEVKIFGIRPLVMITFYHPKHNGKINMHLLHSAFNLTLAESRVVLLLMKGHVVKEIAQKNQVEIDTVRKQLQSIYKKTETCGQVELINLLLNFPKET